LRAKAIGSKKQPSDFLKEKESLKDEMEMNNGGLLA
jgi:hypothetical protein